MATKGPQLSSPADGQRLHRALLTAILVAGLILRLAGLGWGLPDSRHPLATYHPDELINLGAATQADIPHLKFDIGFYNYGTFYFYLVSLAQTVGRGYHLIPSVVPDAQKQSSELDLLRSSAPEQAALFLAGRIVTALLGAATVPVIFLLGRRLYGGAVGLAGAALYAIAPLAVLHAHFLTVDVPATLFVSLTLLGAARMLERPNLRNTMFCGLWLGLAAATKYTAILAAIGPVAAVILAWRGTAPEQRASRNRTVVTCLAALAGMATATFLVACPGPWLNWNVFWNGAYSGSGLRYELFEHSRTGHGYLFVNTGFGWWHHLVVSLRYGLGWPLMLLSLFGIGAALRRRRPADLVLVAFVLVAYLLTSLSAVRFARYLIPLYPALCILSARALMDSASPQYRRAQMAIGGAVAAAALTTSILLVRSLTVPDPRDMAADFFDQNARPGATVAFAHVPWFYSPPLSPRFGAARADIRARAATDAGPLQLLIPAADWDTRALSPAPDFVVLSSFETQHELRRLGLPQARTFVAALQTFRPQTFSSPSLPALLYPVGDDMPDDVAYVLSSVTIYRSGETAPR